MPLPRPAVAPSGRMLALFAAAAIALAVAALGLLAWGEAASAAWADRQAGREGARVARTLATPDDLAAWIEAHPDRAALYLARPGDTLALHADTPRPAVGASAAALTSAARRHVAAGRIAGDARVASSLIGALALDARPPPARDSLGLGELTARTLAGDPAAHDALLLALRMRGLPAAAPGLPPPTPQAGRRLAGRNHTFATPPDTLARAYAAMTPDQRAAQIATMHDGWLHDPEFRAAERAWLAGAAPLPDRTQRALARALLPVASARAVAGALAAGDTLRAAEPGFVTAAVACPGGRAAVVLSDLPLGLWRPLAASNLPMRLARRACPDQ